MIDWSKNIDKLYCLHLVEFTDRYERMLPEFERVGIDVNAQYFEWKYTVRNYFLKMCFENPKLNKFQCHLFSEPRFECVVHHYEIMKTAYELGYERIMIFEDDFRFLKNLDLLEEIMSCIPWDYDLILLDKQAHEDEIHGIWYDWNRYMINKFFYDYTDQVTYFISALCYIVNRKFMKYCVDMMETFIMSIDQYFNNGHYFNWNPDYDKLPELRKAFTVKSIAIQPDHPDANTAAAISDYI